MMQTPTVSAFERIEGSAEPYSLLIVDDDETIVSLLSDMLAGEGRYRILTLTDPQRSLELLKAEPFDLLITDYRMPEMTGLDLIREAKRLHPDLIAILITGFAWPDATSEATEAGAYDLMLKPLNVGEVRVTMRNACEHLCLVRDLRRCRYELERVVQEAIPSVHRMRPAEPMPLIGLFPPNPSVATKGLLKEEWVIEQLERLGKLYQMGLLTKEEFVLSKSRLFGRT